jgi:hypothetical protein
LYEIHEEEGRTGKRTNIRTVYVGLREDKPAVDVRREAARRDTGTSHWGGQRPLAERRERAG